MPRGARLPLSAIAVAVVCAQGAGLPSAGFAAAMSLPAHNFPPAARPPPPSRDNSWHLAQVLRMDRSLRALSGRWADRNAKTPAARSPRTVSAC